MIKLSDFARLHGVTPRAVQQLVKKYENELEGHFERKGQNGTWLDQTAQEFLREHMIKNTVTVYDESSLPFYSEMQDLKKQNADLQAKLNTANEAFQTYVAGTTEQLAKAAERLQLAERAESLELQNRELTETLEKAKLAADELEARARTAEGLVEDTIREIEQTKEDLTHARTEADQAKLVAEAYKKYSEDLDAYLKLPALKRIFVKKPTFDSITEIERKEE